MIPDFLQPSLVASSQMLDCTSPMCAEPIISIQSLD